MIQSFATKNTLRVFFCFVCALFFLSACSSRTVVESDLGIKGAPDWVNEGNQALKDGDNRFFRGIGSASKMGDASLQKSTSDNRARAEVAQIFSSFLDVAAQDYSALAASDGDSVSESAVSRTIKNLTQVNLSGVEIIARWKNKKDGTIYSLAELDLKKLKALKNVSTSVDPAFGAYVKERSENLFDSFSQNK